MAAAYLIVEMHITDPERYGDYMAVAPAAVQAAGGRYLVRGGRQQTLEGDWQPARLALLQFDSYDAAKAFYDGALYQAARRKRDGATEYFNMVLVEGVAAPV